MNSSKINGKFVIQYFKIRLMKKINYLALIILTMIVSGTTIAQELPQPSPAAEVEQRIGLTDVKVVYSRPSVKGREIWGGLEAYDAVWRAGANANTLVTFSDDVKVNGKDLKAGTYSFFITPTKTDWKVMFNSVIDGWGTGKYKAENDVLTLTVKPGSGIMQESLRYTFEKLTKTKGSLVFAWEKVYIDLSIEVDVDKKAWENVDKAVAEATGEDKSGIYRNAAKHAASTKMRLDEGLKWINESIELKESWYSYWVKADVQHAAGDNAGAIASAKKAIELGEAGAKESGKPFGYKERLEKAITEFK
jgi:Protein of unknown function (DUF2911)